jgi:hypothetical protein
LDDENRDVRAKLEVASARRGVAGDGRATAMQGWRRWGFLFLRFDLGEGKEKGSRWRLMVVWLWLPSKKNSKRTLTFVKRTRWWRGVVVL